MLDPTVLVVPVVGALEDWLVLAAAVDLVLSPKVELLIVLVGTVLAVVDPLTTLLALLMK